MEPLWLWEEGSKTTSLSSINSHYSSTGGYPEEVIYRLGTRCENGAPEALNGREGRGGGGKPKILRGVASVQAAGGSATMTGYGDPC